jgi:hypothetical protein
MDGTIVYYQNKYIMISIYSTDLIQARYEARHEIYTGLFLCIGQGKSTKAWRFRFVPQILAF